MSAERITLMTELRKSSCWMMGRSASAGKFGMASTRIFTSSMIWRAWSASLISIITLPPLEEAVETMRLMPATCWMASSMRSTMVSSTSSGVAPG
jgi:hypothetical protein